MATTGTAQVPDLPKCSVCQSPLRPYNSRKGDWPGTKGKVSTNPLLCTQHQYGTGQTRRVNGRDDTQEWDWTGHVVTKPKVEHVRTVRRLVHERLEGDDYLLVVDALGIGDDID